jgi:multidrug efflux pump
MFIEDRAGLGYGALQGAVGALQGAVMGTAGMGFPFSGGDNNTFVQVGLVVLMGLACKNAILIVELARELELQGKGIVEAALEACRLRLRPIIMTSFAFIAGTVPLVYAHGAGAEVRSATGITVFAGMLGVTLFGLFLTPVFYVGIRKLSGRELKNHGAPRESEAPSHLGTPDEGLALARAGLSPRLGTDS